MVTKFVYRESCDFGWIISLPNAENRRKICQWTAEILSYVCAAHLNTFLTMITTGVRRGNFAPRPIAWCCHLAHLIAWSKDHCLLQ